MILSLAALSLLACEPRQARAPEDPAPSETRTVDEPTPKENADEAPTSALPARVARGVCYAHNWQGGGSRGYGSDASKQTIEYMKELGVGWLSITPFGWMPSLDATTIGGEHMKHMPIPSGAESRDRVAKVIENAHAAGLEVILKPHVWIAGGKWRGSIAPKDGDWASWWSSYQDFILYYAKMAEELDAEAFVVGVELVSALRARPDLLADTVTKIRAVYSGKITYSANWDEFHSPDLWRQFDAVGVQLYPPLSDSTDPSVDELCDALRPHLTKWSELAEQADRPLWLTEVGYKSAPTAVKEPFGWPENLPEELRTQDENIQAVAYRALFEELARHERVEAVYVWKYFTDPATDEEGVFGFSPRGKKAEGVLREAFASP